MECSICCELYNRSFRKPIHCIYCESSVCISCIKQYLLDTIHQPHCMNCRKEWSHSFLMKHLSGFITTDYRKKRELLLFEKAKSKIPDLLPEIEKEKQYRLCTKYIIQTQQELSDWYHKRRYMCIEDWRLEKKSIKETIQQLHIDRILIYETRTERKTFIMKCTIGDCRGYLSNKYKCGLCHGDVCPHCHIELQYEHKCNPDIVANIQELKKNTKPCPKCHIPIYKTEGCDQMWCIQCHTAFSWKSGTIEKGIIHNPHYFEYMKDKEIPRNPHDIICGGLPDYRQVYEYIKKHQLEGEEMNFLRTFYEQVSHHRNYTLQELTMNEPEYDDLILSYLLHEITENKFKSNLYVREEKYKRKCEERQIIETYILIGEESFRKLVQDVISEYQFINEIQEMKQYMNQSIVEVDERYQHTGKLKPNMF